MPDTPVLIEHLFRHQAGRLAAHLARLFGPARLDLAEEAVQQAMLRALETWPDQGVPDNPPAWLFRVARNAAIDALRRDRRNIGEATDALLAGIAVAAGTPGDPAFEEQIRDDELRMIFMCCHPEIPPDSRVALSLKIVSGFGTAEIARAFLADETAIAQRLVRAKRRIREKDLALEIPGGAALNERLDSVLEVIYLVFNEGYTAHEGEDLIRRDLCLEALRLGQQIAASSIAQPKVHALLAVMAFQTARLAARTDSTGDLVLLEDQDRALWDQQWIAAGFHHFDRSMDGDELSEYHVQAAIAATHARAAGNEPVDWPLILELYDQLCALTPSPIAALNRVVAVARVRGAAEALAAMDALVGDPKLDHYHLALATRGYLLLDLGRREEAAACFRAALDCPATEPERRFLRRRLAKCVAE